MLLFTRIVCAVLQFQFVFLRSGLGMKQAFFDRKVANYLPDSVIMTKYAESELECSIYCTRHEACLSVNYKVRGEDKGLCQLNNNTISEKLGGHDDNFVYLGIAEWSVRKAKSREIAIKQSCKELFDDDSSLQNGIYYLQSSTSASKYPVYCHMTEISGCGAGGWTLVMKTDGDLGTFKYSSHYWTDKESYSVADGLEGLTEKESKLASYWNTPFKKICLGMTVIGDRKWMMLDYKASSLYRVIAGRDYQKTIAGRVAWKSLIAGSSLQRKCNKEGFGIFYNGRIEMRIGYMANNKKQCPQSDSCIGFGIFYHACKTTTHITCGNIAQCEKNDNGKN